MSNTIDLRGICCPANFVKAKLALEMIDAGKRWSFSWMTANRSRNVRAPLRTKVIAYQLKETDGFTHLPGENRIVECQLPLIPFDLLRQEILCIGIEAAAVRSNLLCSFSVED